MDRLKESYKYSRRVEAMKSVLENRIEVEKMLIERLGENIANEKGMDLVEVEKKVLEAMKSTAERTYRSGWMDCLEYLYKTKLDEVVDLVIYSHQKKEEERRNAI